MSKSFATFGVSGSGMVCSATTDHAGAAGATSAAVRRRPKWLPGGGRPHCVNVGRFSGALSQPAASNGDIMTVPIRIKPARQIRRSRQAGREARGFAASRTIDASENRSPALSGRGWSVSDGSFDLEIGDRVRLTDGTLAEIVSKTVEGRRILIRHIEGPGNPSLAGSEQFCSEDEIEARVSL